MKTFSQEAEAFIREIAGWPDDDHWAIERESFAEEAAHKASMILKTFPSPLACVDGPTDADLLLPRPKSVEEKKIDPGALSAQKPQLLDSTIEEPPV